MKEITKPLAKKILNNLWGFFANNIKDKRTRFDVDEMFQQLSDLLDSF